MLAIEKLSLKINYNFLIKDLSVSIFPGSITYILGKNGAGKTTLLKQLAGLKKIEEGKIKLYDLELGEFEKPYCLFIGHKLGLELEMRVIDHLEYWAESYNSPQMIPAAIEFWNLEDILEEQAGSLSAGNMKKLSLSKLTCCHAELWLLDEVETNLDELNLKCLHHSIMSKANSGGIILISSHMNNKIEKSQSINLWDFCD